VREAITATDLNGRYLRYNFYGDLTLWDVMRFSDHRRQYTLGGLRRADLAEDPLAQFVAWQDQAIAAGLADPTACVLATRQPDLTMRQRMVLMKGVDERGLVFYTNYQSGKAAALADCDQASMLFPWNELDRQVSVSGAVEGVSEAESDAYFASRPRDSQLGAWASSQSQEIENREALMQQLVDVSARFGEGEIPRPPHWGGYRLIPVSWEFWQGGENRLHDRFRYTRNDDGSWQVTRLQP
jgi:pyridoxamine 5'-phosphate oxidase